MDAGDPRSTRTTLAALGLVLALVAAFAVVPRIFSGGARVGHDAPDFTLPLVANAVALGEEKRTLGLGELRGRAVVLDFWATWCQPCRAEAPIVDAVARRWSDKGVVVLGVHTDDPDGDARAAAASLGLTYPIVHDGDSHAARSYDVTSLPTLVVVSRTGKIVATRTGMTDGAEIDRLIRQAL